ncbi:MAG: YggS family pyridoxal phosphate-dependent enzyme [Saprospiraceae bacterium]|nr:YggS family pyridoxal phosphate-dependent enzyme [Saprospiraceae bacterium]
MFDELSKILKARDVKLVVVSKTQSPERILELYQKGQRIFGENRVQEMLVKHGSLPGDIEWHMIGHLQSNKVKQIAPFVSLIHSVDGFGLLEEINKQAKKTGRVIDCLLQFHVAQESSKFGLSPEEAEEMLNSPEFANMKNVRILGVMGMATFTSNQSQVEREFRQLKGILENLKSTHFADSTYFKEISMGMSGDWELAVENGSTMVRIGSLIFEGMNP